MYRLQRECGGHLSFEVIDQSKESVLDRFAAAVRDHCKTSGATWAEEEIERAKWDDVETLGPGVTINGEPWWGEF